MSNDYNPMQEPFISQAQSVNNAGYQAASALQLRLDTASVLREFEMYLKGKQVVLSEDKQGRIVQKVIWEGKPIVNELGYQSIMQYLNFVINVQSVQANWVDVEMYEDYMVRSRKDFASDMMINRKRFALDKKDYDGLIAKIFRMIEPFMTRPIMDKERGSYAQSLRVQESLQTSPSKSTFSNIPFLGGNKR